MTGMALDLRSQAVRSVLDRLPIPCLVHSSEATCYANPALVRLTGRAVNEGTNPVDLVESGCRSAFERLVALVLAGEPAPEQELLLAGVRGQPIAVHLTSCAATCADETAVLSFFHVENEQLRLEHFLSSCHTGAIEVEREGIVDANDAFLYSIGRERSVFERGCLAWESILAPGQNAASLSQVSELVEASGQTPFECELVRPNGSRLNALITAALTVRDPAWRALCIVIDVTERRRLEEQRAETMRLESVGMLAAGMAHNLNNTLTALMGNAGLALLDGTVASSPHLSAMLREIIASGQRAATLTAQLLAYSGRGRFVVVPMNVALLGRAQLSAMRLQVPANIDLTIDIPEELPAVTGDPRQFRDVLTGLVDNAVEAIGSKPGGQIVVTARVESAALDGDLQPRPYCLFEVRDNGEGMDPDTLARAFDPFFSTRFAGRGLGLAAIRGIVKSSGGSIRARSAPERGSVFEVFLPAAAAYR